MRRSLALSSSLLALVTASCGEPPATGWLGQCREDLMLDDADCALVAGWRLPEELPRARGNRYADDARAAELGHAIFFDDGFSSVEGVSCASCHDPEAAYADGMPTSEVIPGMPGGRNSPSLYDSAWNDGFFFWDGRADSLWSQPLFAMENDIEMATTRLAIAHRVHDVYREEYEAIFGALPDLSDTARFPLEGAPGDPAWEAMASEDRLLVDAIAANVGKALEAYMRRIAAGPSALDAYLDGDRGAISAEAREGIRRFVLSGCGGCHEGPRLSDGRFVQGPADGTDRGRAAGIEILLASPFNSAGPHFDHDAGDALPLPEGPTEDDERAFRTPTLRNVVRTAPYQHDGSKTLAQILSAPGILYQPGDEVVIEAFLRTLDGALPPAEWTTPPAR